MHTQNDIAGEPADEHAALSQGRIQRFSKGRGEGEGVALC